MDIIENGQLDLAEVLLSRKGGLQPTVDGSLLVGIDSRGPWGSGFSTVRSRSPMFRMLRVPVPDVLRLQSRPFRLKLLYEVSQKSDLFHGLVQVFIDDNCSRTAIADAVRFIIVPLLQRFLLKLVSERRYLPIRARSKADQVLVRLDSLSPLLDALILEIGLLRLDLIQLDLQLSVLALQGGHSDFVLLHPALQLSGVPFQCLVCLVQFLESSFQVGYSVFDVQSDFAIAVPSAQTGCPL